MTAVRVTLLALAGLVLVGIASDESKNTLFLEAAAAAASPTPGCCSFPEGSFMYLLIARPDLERRAANGDEKAREQLASLVAELKQRRARVETGDVRAALNLSGSFSLAGRRHDAIEVLRLPAVKDDVRVQDSLQSSLSTGLIMDFRNCRPLDIAALRELRQIWQTLLLKEPESLMAPIFTGYLSRLADLADPPTSRDLIQSVFQLQISPECDKSK